MQYEVDAGQAAGVSTDEREELRRLRAENKRLRDVNEVLKSATIFFAGELDPRNRWRCGAEPTRATPWDATS
ncbi:hypothetical protein [Streptomyces sp. NPDC001436]